LAVWALVQQWSALACAHGGKRVRRVGELVGRGGCAEDNPFLPLHSSVRLSSLSDFKDSVRTLGVGRGFKNGVQVPVGSFGEIPCFDAPWYGLEYSAVIGDSIKKLAFLTRALLVHGLWALSDQSHRRISSRTSNHGISPNDTLTVRATVVDPSHKKKRSWNIRSKTGQGRPRAGSTCVRLPAFKLAKHSAAPQSAFFLDGDGNQPLHCRSTTPT
jgi:hypothetical protein